MCVSPFKEQQYICYLGEDVVCAVCMCVGGGENPFVWCYPCLLYPWVGVVWGAFLTPPLLLCIPGLVGEAACDREQQQVDGRVYPPALLSSSVRLPEGPWVGSKGG